MEKFFPGPLTIILKKEDIVPDIVTAGQDTVGVRMPSGEIARKLVENAGVPIAAPSANVSGKPSGTCIEDVYDELAEKMEEIKKHIEADYFIDGGESELGVASTIVRVENGQIQILRQGSITLEEIKEKIKCH